jgi:hypothetical protein
MAINEQTINTDDIVADLLADLPTNADTQVELPSGSIVKIRPITFEEEKQMVMVAKKGEDPSNLLIEKCVSDIELSKILLIDKIYILFKLRELSFGSVYKFRMSCPACKEQQTISLDINQMPVTSLEGEIETSEITLPMCKKDVVIKRASLKDEVILKDQTQLLDNLWRFIKKFDQYDDPIVIQAVLSKLPAGDINKMVSEVMCEGFGISTEVMVRCSKCGHDSHMELPLDKNFFSVS